MLILQAALSSTEVIQPHHRGRVFDFDPVAGEIDRPVRVALGKSPGD